MAETPDPADDPAARPAAEPGGAVSAKLIESLVCPATGAKLVYDRARGELVSKSAGLAYPIRSGIPIMLIDEARKLDD